jgi:preprotein translocase SecF subunit
LDESTNEAKYEWAQGVEIQPIKRFQSSVESGDDRFDFRFAMRDEWIAEGPEQITARLRQNLEETYADYMVQEGWNARATNVTQAIFEAEATLSLKEPEAFREANPDDYDVLWLSKDRTWGGDVNAARAKKDTWFGEAAPEDVQVLMNPSPAGDRQRVTVRATGVTVANEDDQARKFETFKASVARYFWQDSQNVNIEGDAAYHKFPARARLVVDIVFLQEVDVKAFTEFVRDIPQVRSGPLGGTSLSASAVGDGDKARSFEIQSGEITFSADPTDSAHFSHVEGELNKAITEWLKREGGDGNEISKRFLLSSAIGATVASEMQWRALLAILAALVIIAVYMRVRFASVAWGIAAIVALFFVVTTTLAALAIADSLGADMKIDLVIVAAVLTVIGYAINDTIVNFDRIRETLKRDRLANEGKTPLRDIINQSANLMLPRTLMTGGTTLTSTAIMMIFGGPLLAAFSFTIFTGVVMGTFASVFIAAPVLLLFEKRGAGQLLDLTEEEIKEEKLAPPEEVEEPSFNEDEDKPEPDEKKD